MCHSIRLHLHYQIVRFSLGNVIFMVVPFSELPAADISIFIFRLNFRHRYNPMPVDFLRFRPFSPVNPLSKIRGRSASAMPIPLSEIKRLHPFSNVLPSKVRIRSPFAYFTELAMICPIMNTHHFRSANTGISRLTNTGLPRTPMIYLESLFSASSTRVFIVVFSILKSFSKAVLLA